MKSRIVIAVAVFAATFMVQSPAWAAVTFAPAVSYASGTSTRAIALGDVNGDGSADMVTANAADNNVGVLLGNGDGTFDPVTTHPVGVAPTSVTSGDLNGDGDLDLVTANTNSDDFSVLLGNGDGTFAPTVSYPVGDGPSSVALGDLNGDGDLDLAVTNVLPNDVRVLLGNGDGTFAPTVSYLVGSNPNCVAIGDVDGNGDLDLVTANINSDNISVLLGNGDGTFAPAVSYAGGDGPSSVAVGDLNSDGHPDLAATNGNTDNVSVLLGNGDGTFGAPVAGGTTGNDPRSVAIGDLDGDGNPDLAVANPLSNNVSVLPGNGDGTFAGATNHAVADGAFAVAIGDFDGLGGPEVATADLFGGTVSVLMNTTIIPFTTGPTATISGTVRQGQTLTADEGSPDPVPDSFSYAWFANGVQIVGQTANTLLLTSAHVGKKISVEVTAHKASYLDASDTSPETVPVVGIFTPGPTATITGSARIGSTLTAGAGSPSPTPTALGYRWFADGVQLSQVTKTLKLTSAHHGKRIQVRVYAIRSGYLTASSLSAATARISSLQAKTISLELNDYTVRRGQRVTADIELLAPGEPWSIVLDGKELAFGKASSKGTVITSFTVPASAALGERIIRANGAFPDRTDPDRITIR